MMCREAPKSDSVWTAAIKVTVGECQSGVWRQVVVVQIFWALFSDILIFLDRSHICLLLAENESCKIKAGVFDSNADCGRALLKYTHYTENCL